MKPSFLNLFMNKFNCGRVVPIISVNVSWETLSKHSFGLASPKKSPGAKNRRDSFPAPLIHHREFHVMSHVPKQP